MEFFKILTRGMYFRVRRVAKALKNWRKFGVIMFGSLFLATIALPGTLVAQGDLLRVVITPTSSTIQVGQSQPFNAIVKLNGTPTAPDSLEWFVDSVHQSAASGQTSFSYMPSTAGTYQIRANATKDGLNGSSISTLIAEGDITPPPAEEDNFVRAVITPTSSTIKVGESQIYNVITKLNGTNHGADTIRWFVDGSEKTSFYNSTSITVTPAVQGTFNIRVQAVIGSQSGTDYATLIATPVTPTNEPPVANLIITPNSGNAPLYAVLNSSASYDPDGYIVKYEWDRDGNGSYEYIGSSIIFYTYSTAGAYTVRVRVTDDYGNQASASQTVTVGQNPPANEPPVANLSANPANGDAPLYSVLNASGSYDPDGYIVSYEWDRDGNGSYETTTIGPTNLYTYSVGTYTVRVRVTDNVGATAVATRTVTATNVAPDVLTVTASVDDPIINTYNSTVFRAQAYRDGSQVSASYEWVIISGSGSFTNRFVQNATFNATGNTGFTSVRVYATEGGDIVSANSGVTVQGTVPPIDYIEVIISPRTQNVYPGNTLAYTARVYDRYGSNVTSSSSVLWTLPNSSAGYIESQINYGSYSQVVVRAGSVLGTFPVRAQGWYSTLYDTDEVTMTVGQNIPPYPPTPNYWINASLHGVIEDGSTPSKGDVVVYTLLLANYQSNTVHNVIAKVLVPDYTTFLSAYSDVDNAYISGDVVYWSAGDFTSGQVKTMTMRVQIIDNLPSGGVVIQTSAPIYANEVSGFTVYSNKLYVGGIGGGGGHLVDTGIEIEVLAMLAVVALMLSVMGYAFLNRREIMAKLRG